MRVEGIVFRHHRGSRVPGYELRLELLLMLGEKRYRRMSLRAMVFRLMMFESGLGVGIWI